MGNYFDHGSLQSFFQQKCQTLSGSSFSSVRIHCCFYITVGWTKQDIWRLHVRCYIGHIFFWQFTEIKLTYKIICRWIDKEKWSCSLSLNHWGPIAAQKAFYLHWTTTKYFLFLHRRGNYYHSKLVNVPHSLPWSVFHIHMTSSGTQRQG